MTKNKWEFFYRRLEKEDKTFMVRALLGDGSVCQVKQVRRSADTPGGGEITHVAVQYFEGSPLAWYTEPIFRKQHALYWLQNGDAIRLWLYDAVERLNKPHELVYLQLGESRDQIQLQEIDTEKKRFFDATELNRRALLSSLDARTRRNNVRQGLD